MSAAVRDVLRENAKLIGKEVEAEVKKRNPGKKVNSGSLNVAFSNARRKLGMAKGKKRSVKRRKASAGTSEAVDMGALQAARKYVTEVGDVDAALEAVRQLRALQVSTYCS